MWASSDFPDTAGDWIRLPSDGLRIERDLPPNASARDEFVKSWGTRQTTKNGTGDGNRIYRWLSVTAGK